MGLTGVWQELYERQKKPKWGVSKKKQRKKEQQPPEVKGVETGPSLVEVLRSSVAAAQAKGKMFGELRW